MGGALPSVDFLLRIFCTESFDLEVDPAGLDTEDTSCACRTRPASDPLSPESTGEKAPRPGRDGGPGLTLPVSSGPGWRVTEHGRFRGI